MHRVDALVKRLSGMSPMALKRGKYAIAAMDSMAFHDSAGVRGKPRSR